MMKEMALHVLDITENSVRGGAGNIEIEVSEDKKENLFSLRIIDDGRGIDPAMLKTIKNPFTTTRTHRKVGMGIPFLNDTCEMCGGKLSIESEPGKGTRVTAILQEDHIDKPPLGDMASTLMTLFSSYPEICFRYVHRVVSPDGAAASFSVSTEELQEILEGVPLSTPSIQVWVREFIAENISSLHAGNNS